MFFLFAFTAVSLKFYSLSKFVRQYALDCAVSRKNVLLEQWFSFCFFFNLFVPQPIIATHYNPTTHI